MRRKHVVPNQPEQPEDLSEYRKHLQSLEQKAQEDFDKTVLSLSGGALGISFVFLKDVVGPNPVLMPNLLFAAWLSWGVSTFCVLLSYYFSHLALRRTIQQVDQATIRTQKPGGMYRHITAILNAGGAILFLAGVTFMVFFANANLKNKGEVNDKPKAPITASSAASAASAAAPARLASTPRN